VLTESLLKAGVSPGRVNLVSRQVAPFGPYAAPIHKIMVQHARREGAIRYRQGELSAEDGERRVISLLAERERVALSDRMRVVVRHGSPANLKGLASDAEMGSLRIRQFMLADYIPEHRRTMTPPDGYPDRDTQQELYIGVRREMVAELLDSLIPGATVSAEAHGFVVERPLLPPKGRQGLDLPLPDFVFGIRLSDGEILEAEAL